MKAKETHHRRLSILQNLPPYPRKTSSRALLDTLKNQGFDVTLRTIQRDLDFLSGTGLFGIGSDPGSKPTGWYWIPNASGMQIPFMDMHTAISFSLLNRYSDRLWPTSIREHMKPYFLQAENILKDRKGWDNKIAFQGFKNDSVKRSVKTTAQESIYSALDQDRCISAEVGRYFRGIDIDYISYSCIHPLGLLITGTVTFLIAKLERDTILRFPMHRLRNVKLLDRQIAPPNGFDLQDFVDSQPFVEIFNPAIELELEVDRKIAILLVENPIACNQTITATPQSGRFSVKATVDDSTELRSARVSFGSSIKVIAPDHLQALIRREARKLAETYDIAITGQNNEPPKLFFNATGTDALLSHH